MEGQAVSHDRILKKIGEGGMGEACLAEDTRLDRKVTPKFLPQYFLQDEVAQKRSVREAKSTATSRERGRDHRRADLLDGDVRLSFRDMDEKGSTMTYSSVTSV